MSDVGAIPAAQELPFAEALSDVLPAAEWTPPKHAAGALGAAEGTPEERGPAPGVAMFQALPLASAIPWGAARPAPWEVPPLPIPTEAGAADLLTVVAIVWAVEFFLGVVAAVIALAGGAGGNVAHLVPWAVALSNVNAVVMCWLFACRKYGKGLVEGLAFRRVGVLTALGSVFLGAAMAVGAFYLVVLFPPWMPIEESQDPLARATWVALIVLIPPFEETYYRGFLFSVLKRLAGAWPAVFIVTAWFASAHWNQFVAAPITIPILTTLGFVQTLQRSRTGSVIPPMLTHWTYNTMLVVLPFILG